MLIEKSELLKLIMFAHTTFTSLERKRKTHLKIITSHKTIIMFLSITLKQLKTILFIILVCDWLIIRLHEIRNNKYYLDFSTFK